MKKLQQIQRENAAISNDILSRAGSLTRKLADINAKDLSDETITKAMEHTAAPVYCRRAARILIDAGYITMNKVNALIEADRRDRAAGILQDLKNEIAETLIFFCSMDMKLHGHITPGTVTAFNTQNVVFPEILKPFVKIPDNV